MKVLIVEDHTMFRDVIRHICVDLGHEIAGETGLGNEAVGHFVQLQPDLLILDLELPDTHGLAVMGRVRPLAPALRVLGLSAYLDLYTVYCVERAGLDGFIDKASTPLTTLREAVTALAAGHSYFSSTFTLAKRVRLQDPNAFDKLLSKAELRVLPYIAQGLNDAEIAVLCGITPWTAQAHRSHILKKLRIDGTPKLVAFAQQNGFARFPYAC